MQTQTSHERLVDALNALCDRVGGYKAVAEQISTSSVYLWQILHKVPLKSGKPRGIGRELRSKLDTHFPDWLESQHSNERAKLRGEGAHILSEHDATYSPQIHWESVMSQQKLPATFRVAMPDDSMSPRVRRGDLLEFNSQEQPRSGDGVLVRDGAGVLFFRVYRQRSPGSWEAHPINPEFLALDSRRDSLVVVGVMVGAPRNRWG